MKAIVILVAAYGLFAAQPPATYSGSWVMRNNSAEKLVMERTGDTIHVRELKGDSVKSDYTCTLTGKDCDFKEDGHKAKVSLWFNGDKLVELRTRGDVVTKRRFTLEDNGSKLEVEVLPMAPPGRNETVAYSRQ